MSYSLLMRARRRAAQRRWLLVATTMPGNAPLARAVLMAGKQSSTEATLVAAG